MLKTIRKILLKIDKIEKVILGLIFLALTATIMVQVIIRTLRIGTIIWLEELSRFIIIESGVLCACIVTTERSHLCLDFVMEKLPVRLRCGIAALLEFGSAGLCGWLGVKCVGLIQIMIPVNMRYSTLPMPKWAMYVPIAVFLITMGLRFVHVAAEDVRDAIHGKLEDRGEAAA